MHAYAVPRTCVQGTLLILVGFLGPEPKRARDSDHCTDRCHCPTGQGPYCFCSVSGADLEKYLWGGERGAGIFEGWQHYVYTTKMYTLQKV